MNFCMLIKNGSYGWNINDTKSLGLRIISKSSCLESQGCSKNTRNFKCPVARS